MYYPSEYGYGHSGGAYGCGRKPHSAEQKKAALEARKEKQKEKRQAKKVKMVVEQEEHSFSNKAKKGLAQYRKDYADMKEANPDWSRAEINEYLKLQKRDAKRALSGKVKYIPVGKTKLDVNKKLYHDFIVNLTAEHPKMKIQKIRDAAYALAKELPLGKYPKDKVPEASRRPISDYARARGLGHHHVGHYW